MKDMRSRKNSVATFICFLVLFMASAGVDAAPIFWNTGVDNNGNGRLLVRYDNQFQCNSSFFWDIPVFEIKGWADIPRYRCITTSPPNTPNLLIC